MKYIELIHKTLFRYDVPGHEAEIGKINNDACTDANQGGIGA